MPLIALTTNKDHVDLEAVQTVVAELGYEFEIRRLNDPIEADNTIARLEERIRRALARGPLTKREIQPSVHAERPGVWACNAAMNNLLADGALVSSSAHSSCSDSHKNRL